MPAKKVLNNGQYGLLLKNGVDEKWLFEDKVQKNSDPADHFGCQNRCFLCLQETFLYI